VLNLDAIAALQLSIDVHSVAEAVLREKKLKLKEKDGHVIVVDERTLQVRN
jgi:hypothetical protein